MKKILKQEATNEKNTNDCGLKMSKAPPSLYVWKFNLRLIPANLIRQHATMLLGNIAYARNYKISKLHLDWKYNRYLVESHIFELL